MTVQLDNSNLLELLRIFSKSSGPLSNLAPQIAKIFVVPLPQAQDVFNMIEFDEVMRLMKDEWLINIDGDVWNSQQPKFSKAIALKTWIGIETRGFESLKAGKILLSAFGSGRKRGSKPKTAPTAVSKSSDGMRDLIVRKSQDVPSRATVNNIAASIAARQGQKAFRDDLLAVYGDRCLVTGPNIRDILEAAHIQPYADGGPSNLSNGLLLRADIHTLFDLYLIAIDADMNVLISPELLGTPYADLAEKPLQFPDGVTERPNKTLLEQHRQAAELW